MSSQHHGQHGAGWGRSCGDGSAAGMGGWGRATHEGVEAVEADAGVDEVVDRQRERQPAVEVPEVVPAEVVRLPAQQRRSAGGWVEP